MSRESEALGLFDGYEEALVEDLLAGVLRKVQLVEAGVATGQTHDVVTLDLSDCELLRAAHSNESLEPVHWHLAAACHEL